MGENMDDVAIVGGGICGLTTALALERRGVSPTVYEAASEYRPVGAGILLQTNALLVFDRLGIADRIRSAGVPLDETRIRSPRGRVLQRFDLEGVERDRFGYGYVAIHRGDLQRILLEELDAEVETGMACTAVRNAEQPVVRFDDGTRIDPDVLVGADGIDSTVREAVTPGTDVRTLETTVYRAVVTYDRPADRPALGREVWGHGTYTGGAPIDADRFYWFATAPRRFEGVPNGQRGLPAGLRERFGGFPDPIPAVVDSLEREDVITTRLADVPSLERWHRGSVVLAGDAAHGMLPFAGQGAAQAIEDAITLADAIDTGGGPADAFDSYERERKPRADRIRSESYWLGKLGTTRSSVACRARNRVAALLPNRVVGGLRRRRIADTSLGPAEPP
jgi:2-polyprenyl-6-methoxyphenol hydroxylase-like FAD-dependent oxidoreductase